MHPLFDFIRNVLHDEHTLLASLMAHIGDAWNTAESHDLALSGMLILLSIFIYNHGRLLLPSKEDPLTKLLFEVPQKSMGLVKSQKSKVSRDISVRVAEDEAQIIVFWGSQSGTAEDFAHRTVRDLQHDYDVKVACIDMSDFNPSTLLGLSPSVRCIFLASTFGEGEPSDNARDFLAWVEASPPASLNGVRYAAFGCGNSNYRYFNKTIDDITGFMDKNGAQIMMPVAKGDEALRTTEEDFIEWKDNLITQLASELGLKQLERDYVPSLLVEEVTLCMEQTQLSALKPHVGRGGDANVNLVQVASARQLAASYNQGHRSVLEVTLDLSLHPQVKYKTGDHIAIWPENRESEMSHLLTVLGLASRGSSCVSITSTAGGDALKMPNQLTIDTLFRRYLDICGPISREAVLALSRMAPTHKIRDSLKSLGKNKETYYGFLHSNHMTIARLLSHSLELDDTASWHVLPLSFIIELLPRIKPRLYSISSSTVVSPRKVSLTVSVKPGAVPGNLTVAIPGLASNYLETLHGMKPGQCDEDANMSPHQLSAQIWAQIRLSTFKLPMRSQTPLVMVAAGTGIAPFRGFVQERARLGPTGRDIGRMVLFFGCQTEDDYLYREELRELMDGPLKGKLEVVTAFSRSGGAKVYVQDQIRAREADVTELMLNQGAAFYICGAAIMAKDVTAALLESVKTHTGWDQAEIDSWRAGLKRSKRWFEDVWS
ncbi:hypothetical protein QQS21_008785 [Conoideocrella luteorostrata]|uniref:NADPH--hemoprotein reductase n=1 Tax=Conoideocrella luteorostrata TaxID=1105319 RepID=A0AAJ0FVN6_9HYPO|nr:hypothetical protein QQS21_008785 [Conoideocrella luteorostrata]